MLKQHAINVVRTQKDIEGLQSDILALETELATTGSSRTADEVQLEIDQLSSQMSGFIFFSTPDHDLRPILAANENARRATSSTNATGHWLLNVQLSQSCTDSNCRKASYGAN